MSGGGTLADMLSVDAPHHQLAIDSLQGEHGRPKTLRIASEDHKKPADDTMQ